MIRNGMQHDGENRAVSPVIGVILMVAITVILAAVIGAFVLEIGDQQETAPNTSFDSEQETNFYRDAKYDGSCQEVSGGSGDAFCLNATEVLISHAGGDVVDVTQGDIIVGGNGSVWGTESPTTCPNSDPDCSPPSWLADSAQHYVAPQPDIRESLGTNDQVTFQSGEAWRVSTYGGEMSDYPGSTDGPLLSDDNMANHRFRAMFKGGSNFEGRQWVFQDADGSAGPTNMLGHNLESSDVVRVIWTASSGGKTQTLFKYTVQ